MHSISQRDVEALVEKFRHDCRDAGMSLTHQREVIFRALVEMDGHPSPEAIYGRVKKQIPAISLATVYKNLRTFLDTGLAREVSLHHGALRLETNSIPHHHFVCVRCKEIFDIEAHRPRGNGANGQETRPSCRAGASPLCASASEEDHLMPVELRQLLPEGFRLQRYSVEFQGLCGPCAASSSHS